MRSVSFLFLAFLVFLTSCTEPKSFEIKSVKSIKVEKLGVKENVFNAELECFNPNDFGVVIKKIDCDIFVNDQKLSHYLLESNINVPASSNFILPAKLEIALSSILGYGVDIMFNKPFKIVVNGNATVSKGIFTKNIAINYATTKTFNLKEAAVRDLVKTIQNQMNK
jgi:LEA14-like dessication related protein